MTLADLLSIAPAFADTRAEIVPYSLWVVSLIGGYRVYKQVLAQKETAETALRRHNEDLLGRLANYESRKPYPQVGFCQNGQLVDRYEVAVPVLPAAKNIRELQYQARQVLLDRLEQFAAQAETTGRVATGIFTSMVQDMIWSSKKQEYERNVERYVVELEQYIRDRYVYDLNKTRVRPVRLGVANQGNASLNSVILRIEVQDGNYIASDAERRVFEDDSNELAPELPDVPDLPSLSDHLPVQFAQHLDYHGSVDASSAAEVNHSGRPKIRFEGRSAIVTYDVGTVSPGRQVDDLEPFYLQLRAVEREISVPVEVMLYSMSLPEPMTASLQLVVMVASTDSTDAA